MPARFSISYLGLLCNHLAPMRLLPTTLLLIAATAVAPAQNNSSRPYAQWTNGPSSDPSFFPLAVWLQAPANAERYRKAGFNTYVALWNGPTEAQLATLAKAGMRLICEQNKVALRHLDDPTIIGWMHGDEPDNAQALPDGKGYGPPVEPAKIIRDYEHLRAADPSRPVMLNLGQGVAWDGWYGRGSRSNHPEDYPQYIKGGDIISFDIYPVVHDRPEIAGNLSYVARGVERLVRWSEGRKIVWNCLECTRISNPDRKPTPREVQAEAWMSLIHGSRGFIYFVHQFKPTFREAALFDDSEMLEAVTRLNARITELAPILNSPTLTNVVRVDSAAPVALMTKQHGGATYLFTAAMSVHPTDATFTLKAAPGDSAVEALGETRRLTATDGTFKDHFGPWDFHIYRLPSPKPK